MISNLYCYASSCCCCCCCCCCCYYCYSFFHSDEVSVFVALAWFWDHNCYCYYYHYHWSATNITFSVLLEPQVTSESRLLLTTDSVGGFELLPETCYVGVSQDSSIQGVTRATLTTSHRLCPAPECHLCTDQTHTRHTSASHCISMSVMFISL